VTPRQRKIEALKRLGVKSPGMVLSEAKRADLNPEYALAMLEKETGIPQQNIFGCDHGPGRAFCHMKVTKERVAALRASGAMNGVGWTQITWWEFVRDADNMGGAHLPRFQMRVGFDVLAAHIAQYGVWDGFRRYNGSGSAAEAYANEAVGLAKKWNSILEGD
jgi:hypothetical protein